MADRPKHFSMQKKSNRGNALEFKYVFPEKTSDQTLNEVTMGLSYCGLFHGVLKGEKPTKN